MDGHQIRSPVTIDPESVPTEFGQFGIALAGFGLWDYMEAVTVRSLSDQTLALRLISALDNETASVVRHK